MELPEIPSEFIEPYLQKFMGSMVGFIANAYLTEAEKQEVGRGCGWTVAEIKTWINGVDVFINQSCGLHAQLAMSNQAKDICRIPDDKLREICKEVMRGSSKES